MPSALRLRSLRSFLYKSIEARPGSVLERVKPIAVSKDMLRRMNETLGRPLASAEELGARAAAEEKLASLKASESRNAETRATQLQAPITVYYERDQYASERRRIEEFLTAKGFTFKALDVQDDETTRSFATTKAKTTDFPLVFIADDAVGGYRELVALDVAGGLQKALFPSG